MTEGYSGGKNQEKAKITELLESAQGRRGLVGSCRNAEKWRVVCSKTNKQKLFVGKTNKQELLKVIYWMRRWGRSSGIGGTGQEEEDTEKGIFSKPDKSENI